MSNGRATQLQSELNPGLPVIAKILNTTSYPDPAIKVFGDNKINLWFSDQIPVTTKLQLIIEQDQLEEQTIEYTTPENSKGIKALQYKRGEIIDSQKKIYFNTNARNALSFDQSYYTRSIGQCKISADLEDKNGLHYKNYQLITGAGFGAIQAAHAALGLPAQDLSDWWNGALRKTLKKWIIRKAGELTIELAFGKSFDRIGTTKIQNTIQKLFYRENTKTDYKIKDCKNEIFIPVMDIDGRALSITKQSYPEMPVYLAVCCSLLDPLWFATKPLIQGFSVLTGDIHKSNDMLISKPNPTLHLTSIGAPVRIYEHGLFKIARDGLALRLNDQKHAQELMQAEEYLTNRKRLQCNPLDEIKQFDFSDIAVEKAIQSGANK